MTHPDAYIALRMAVRAHRDWPDTNSAAAVISAAERMADAVDTTAQAIDHMRNLDTDAHTLPAPIRFHVVDAEAEPLCFCGHRMQSDHHGDLYRGSRACDKCTCPVARMF